MPEAPVTETLQVAGNSLTVALYGELPIQIVLLHDGLGSISQWREVPALIAEVCDVGVLAYDRAGHGEATPLVPSGPDWLHQEARVLSDVLAHYGIKDPLIVGHSDGGSIALIHAAAARGCKGVVTLAAHTFVEQICVDNITEMRATPGPIVIGLARHHASPRELFDSWSQVWTSADFRPWDIRPIIGSIECPVLVVQGQADDFATDAQLTETVAAIGQNAVALRVPGVGHVLHHEAPDQVVEIVCNFFRSLR